MIPFIFLFILLNLFNHALAQSINKETAVAAEEAQHSTTSPGTAFDDSTIVDNYAKKYKGLNKETLLEMIKDESLGPYKSAAAVKVFKETFSGEIVHPEKRVVERILLRRLSRSDSPILDVELMHTLVLLDRYRYFESMTPALIQKLDHYNSAVNKNAFNSMEDIVAKGNNRAREARIVFNTLRKTLFLSRKRLATMKEIPAKIKYKINLLRWSVKVLGTQELRRLPKEVIAIL